MNPVMTALMAVFTQRDAQVVQALLDVMGITRTACTTNPTR
jgi:hypothetical protein